MKRLITALFLVACTTAAFASTPTHIFSAGDLLEGVQSDSADVQAWAKAVITGVALGDDKVCSADVPLGDVADQGALTLKDLLRKYPNISDEAAGYVMKLILEDDYKCK